MRLFQTIKEVRRLSHPFYEANIILTIKIRERQYKKITDYLQPFLNIDGRILNKLLIN